MWSKQFGWRGEIRDPALDMISLRCLSENQMELWTSVVCMSLGSRSRFGCSSGSRERMDRCAHGGSGCRKGREEALGDQEMRGNQRDRQEAVRVASGSGG